MTSAPSPPVSFPLCLQDSQWFRARLKHLQERRPAELHRLLVEGHRRQLRREEHPLTRHLLQVAHDATQAQGRLLEAHKRVEPEQARERVMHDVVAPSEAPQEQVSTLKSRESDRLLQEWNESLDSLPPIHHL